MTARVSPQGGRSPSAARPAWCTTRVSAGRPRQPGSGGAGGSDRPGHRGSGACRPPRPRLLAGTPAPAARLGRGAPRGKRGPGRHGGLSREARMSPRVGMKVLSVPRGRGEAPLSSSLPQPYQWRGLSHTYPAFFLGVHRGTTPRGPRGAGRGTPDRALVVPEQPRPACCGVAEPRALSGSMGHLPGALGSASSERGPSWHSSLQECNPRPQSCPSLLSLVG